MTRHSCSRAIRPSHQRLHIATGPVHTRRTPTGPDNHLLVGIRTRICSRLLGPCYKTGNQHSQQHQLSGVSPAPDSGVVSRLTWSLAYASVPSSRRGAGPRISGLLIQWKGGTEQLNAAGRAPPHTLSTSGLGACNHQHWQRSSRPQRDITGPHCGSVASLGPFKGNEMQSYPAAETAGHSAAQAEALAASSHETRSATSPSTISGTQFSSLCRVLCTGRSLYLCNIGLASIFDLAGGIPRTFKLHSQEGLLAGRKRAPAVALGGQLTHRAVTHVRSAVPDRYLPPKATAVLPLPTFRSAVGRSRSAICVAAAVRLKEGRTSFCRFTRRY